MGLRNSLPNTSSGGGVTDHGALTGLADDDHTQYLTTTRHSAITGNPHSTVAADITDFNETVRDTIGTALVAGSNVTITVNDGADTITVAATAAAAANERVKTNYYVVADSPATWTKESWCKTVRIQAWAPGGSGGGGSRRAAGVAARGGGGGVGGCVADITIPGFQFGATETVTVGAVGAVGVGATADSTAGTSASASTDCTVGTILRVTAGSYGRSESTPGSAISSGGVINTTLVNSPVGGTGYNGASTVPPGSSAIKMPTSGGGGGGISAANARVAGTEGGAIPSTYNGVFNSPVVTSGGSAVGAAGGNGATYVGVGFGGGGGAPGDTAGTAAGAAGGNGGFPGGGGGGGGGSRNGANAGNGGSGGAGLVIITQYG